MRIDTTLNEGSWVDWEDGASFRLRPYPLTLLSEIGEGFEEMMTHTLKMFRYCVVDWKGLEGEDGKPFACNDKWKQYVFDHCPDLREFVMGIINSKMGGEDKESKN